jgi:Mce-associated membrane protein
VTGDETSVAETTEAKAAAEETADAEETVDAEETEPIDDDNPDDSRPGLLKRFGSRAKASLSGRILAGLLAVLVVISVALLGWSLYSLYLPDRETDAAAAKSALSAASDGTVAVLSYSPDTVDRDFTSAKSHLTGDFLKYYEQFTQQIVGPAAKQKGVKTTAVVLRSALTGELHPDSAVVLLFVNQTTQSKDRPEPTMTSSSVLATMTKADGKWLISSFNPV